MATKEPANPDDLARARLGARHAATLVAVFERPTRADVRWTAVENMLRALGATIKQGRGSRVRVLLAGRILLQHEPHPAPTMAKGAVEDVRDFLANAGINP